MSGAYIHLLTNHIPVLATLFGLLVLAAGLLRRNLDVTRVGLVLLVAAALGSVPAYFSGEEAEEMVEHLPGVPHDAIEEHEEAALPAMIAVDAAGLLALASLVLGRGGRATPRALLVATAVVAAVGFGLIARAANLGGQVRHSEIREGGAAAGEPAGEEGSGRGRGRGGREPED